MITDAEAFAHVELVRAEAQVHGEHEAWLRCGDRLAATALRAHAAFTEVDHAIHCIVDLYCVLYGDQYDDADSPSY